MSNKVKRRLKKDALKRERKLARKLATYSLAAGASLFAAGAAEAVVVNDFTGPFAAGNWTNWNDPGAVKPLTWPYGDTTMEIKSNSAETVGFVSGGSDILAPGTGTISFTFNTYASGYGGVFDAYCDPNTADPENVLRIAAGSYTGSRMLNIVEGEPIVFRMYSSYSGQYLASVGITCRLWVYDFVADYAEGAVVPEPQALSLLALGAAGVAGLRRRRS